MKNNKTIFGRICNMRAFNRGLTLEAKIICRTPNSTVQYFGKSEARSTKKNYVKNNDKKTFFRKMG